MTERLWAPWRLAYINSQPPAGCIFCEKPRQNRDAENLILHQAKRCFVILNAFPYNTGHLMVVPRPHVASLDALDSAHQTELMRWTTLAVEALKAAFAPQGFNLGMNMGQVAGAGIADHLHLHVVPRWSGDTNFMPIIGDTKVLPEALNQTYQRLKPAFERLAEPTP